MLFNDTKVRVKKEFPPHLISFLTSIFNIFNLSLINFIVVKIHKHYNSDFDWLGLFTSEQFSIFFYLTIVIGLGQIISYMVIVRLFEPIFPAISALFEPVITSLLISFL